MAAVMAVLALDMVVAAAVRLPAATFDAGLAPLERAPCFRRKLVKVLGPRWKADKGSLLTARDARRAPLCTPIWTCWVSTVFPASVGKPAALSDGPEYLDPGMACTCRQQVSFLA